MKNKKKELVRTIHIKQDEETQFDLVIGDKTQAALISSSISEIEIKGKKYKITLKVIYVSKISLF